ncbi:sigma-70 family RNA polymerase sigma factor [Tibeticola sp.]|uniref:sigma-70 family RNA polymerase sigma factor n=1 Tax=Tibeticola sp. TaxID=2005368 RepID=UPI0025D6A507|nr:sigma-70 family RNA polymerase sigma factor [Tibeticola sp.]
MSRVQSSSKMAADTTPSCITRAWTTHEAELRRWLRARLRDPADADDLMQELFIKALRQGARFCDVRNARAWLFEVARNLLADSLRVARDTVELPETLIDETEELPAVDALTACLPAVLAELSDADRDIITRCDLEGMPQADYAAQHGLSLSAAKSRVQRARERLRARLAEACQVRFDEHGRVEDFAGRRAGVPS